MHDLLAVLGLTGQEWVSDVQEIAALLAVKRHAWPYPRMAEEVIADRYRNLERF